MDSRLIRAAKDSARPSSGSRRPPVGIFIAGLTMLVAAEVGIVLVALAELRVHEAGVVTVCLLGLAMQVAAWSQRLLVLIAAIVYIGVLGWAYSGLISDTYAYQGMVNQNPGATDVLVTATLAWLPAVWLPLGRPRPSVVILWTLYLLAYVPSTLIPLYVSGSLSEILPFLVTIAGSMVLIAWMTQLHLPPVGGFELTRVRFSLLITMLALVSLAYVALSFGVSFTIPNLEDVYETRSEFRSAVGSGVLLSVGGYLIPWAGNAINPILLSIGLMQRRAGLIMIALAGQLLIYSVTGFKSVLFTVALVPLVYVVVAVAPRWFAILSTAGMSIVVGLALLATSTLASPWPVALVTRLLATPGQLTAHYVEYFSTHPHFALSHSVLRGIVPTPYGEDAPFIIGAAYFSPGTNANGGIWADAFANFGLAGVLGFTILLGLGLLVLDAIAHGRDPRLIAPMLAIAGLSLANAGLLTTIMTLGLGLGTVLITLTPQANRVSMAAASEAPVERQPEE